VLRHRADTPATPCPKPRVACSQVPEHYTKNALSVCVTLARVDREGQTGAAKARVANSRPVPLLTPGQPGEGQTGREGDTGRQGLAWPGREREGEKLRLRESRREKGGKEGIREGGRGEGRGGERTV
jgi:hypothetical protein